MNGFPKTLLGAATALVIAGGAGLAPSGPARADSWREDCSGGTCVRMHCYDDGFCARRDENYTAADWRVEDQDAYRPLRYACDMDGDNCRYTHHYFIDGDGNAEYDSGLKQIYP